MVGSKRARWVLPLVAWTLFVWSSRIVNIWRDDGLSVGGQVLRTGIALLFLVFAVTTAARLWQRRAVDLGPGDQWFLGLFVAWTIGFWLVRGIGIIVDDHELGFTVVHTVLMVLSIGLAVAATRVLPRRSISSSVATAR